MKNIYIEDGKLIIERTDWCYNATKPKRAIQALYYDITNSIITEIEYNECMRLING